MASSATFHSTMDPSPRAELVIDPADLLAETAAITIWQQWADGRQTVRDAEQVTITSEFYIEDYEVSPGVPVEYRVEQFSADGVSLGYALSLTGQVALPRGYAVIQDPLAPNVAALVRAEYGFAATSELSRETELIRAGGQTIALMGELSLLQNVPLTVITETPEDHSALLAAVRETFVLIRTGPEMPLPRNLYAVVPSISRNFADARNGGDLTVWELVGQEVERASNLAILAPTVTWQQIMDAYDSWDEVMAAHPTWRDLIQNPPTPA